MTSLVKGCRFRFFIEKLAHKNFSGRAQETDQETRNFFCVTNVSFLYFVLVITKEDLSNLVAVAGKYLDYQGKLMESLPLRVGKPEMVSSEQMYIFVL